MNFTDQNHPVLGQAVRVVTLLTALFTLGTHAAPAQETTPSSGVTNTAATAKAAPEPAAEEQLGEYNNWLTLGVGHFFVNGDEAQFMRRRQHSAGTFGGVEDLHFEQAFGKKGIFEIDGRGIFDENDYSLRLSASDPDKGFVRAGYREFRTWYDGSAGFSPKSNAWVSLYNEELHVDRGEAFIEAGLTVPDWPVLSLRYSYQFREGRKDSLSWGDYNLNIGAAGTNLRGIVPTFWKIDENRHIVDADVKHAIGKTEFGVGARYEISDNDNSRNIHRRPGELPPVATPGTDRFVTQKEGVHTDLFNVHAFTETRFTEQLLFTMGYSYTTMDTDISGSRIYGSDYDPLYDPVYARRQQRDEGFLNLGGGAELHQHVANLNLMFAPVQDLTLVPSVRIEEQNQTGVSHFTETDVGAGPGFLATQTDLTNTKERQFIDVTESLEARYTGIPKWSFYTRGEWLQGQGDLEETETEAPSGPVAIFRETDVDRLTQKYTLGANWYPHGKVNLGGQYYYKIRQNDYDHEVDSTVFAPPATNDFYPAFIRQQDFDTHDVNFRVTWRALPNLTLVTRYDFQLSSIDTQGTTDPNGVRLNKLESAEMTSHIISESISWSPLARLFLQGSVSYVLDQTDTPANDLGGGATDLVLAAKNDYWNASVLAGFALDSKTDLQAQYFCYFADNYEDNSSVSVPYGAEGKEHGVTASVLRRIHRNILLKLTYGFFSHHDRTSGGHNDYTAHMVYSSMQLRF
jgi:hypothetical protein